ncbi:MAG TPA: hypothetical protein VNC59_01610 [Thermoanaerobaculia bacterium]|nr:hypothetical protein [Thermoanaerobaculia bacterium]
MSRRAALLFPYAVFVLLAAVSWNRWVEPFVDTGRELMVPARVAAGEALYRDVRFYYGPLAPYLAAGVDLLFGRTFPARIALAGLIALLHVEALRRLARRLLPETTASLAASLAVGVTFFLRPGGCHLFPYSLDTSIAVAAATGAIVLGAAGGSARRDRVAALLLAAALLSRPEIGLAAIAAIAIERIAGRDSAAKRRLAWLSAAPVAAAAVVYAALSAGTPAPILAKEGWLTFLFLPREFANVYSSFSGVDRPGLRTAELALAVIGVVFAGLWLFVASIASARARLRSAAAGRAIEAGALVVLVAAAGVALFPPEALRDTMGLVPPLVRPLPPLLILAALVGTVRRLRDRSRETIVAGVPDSALLLALFFCARLLLAAGYVGPYNGFYLPLPMVVGSAVLLRAAARLPGRIEVTPPPFPLPRLVAAALAIFLAARIAALAAAYRHPAWTEVDTPAGSLMVTEPVAGAFRAALADLRARVRAGGAIATFPEAGIFNWVLDRRNPLAQDQFFPGHLDAAAEEDSIARLRAGPSDAVVLLNVLTIGHGRTAFGRDYLQSLGRFLDEEYRTAAVFGPGATARPRIGDRDFFIEVRVPGRGAAP